jgi:oligopeptide transport system substrate-binding protein
MPRVSKEFPTELQIAPVLGTFFLALNLTRPPFNGSRALRQALSMAVERDMISANVASRVAPAYSFVAEGIHDYTPARYGWRGQPPGARIESARDLYRSAGYSADHPLHVRLYFNNNDTIRRVMIAVAGSWQQNLGVVTELVSDEFRVFLDGRKDRGKWDAVRLGWSADYDDAASFLEMFGRAGNQDDSGYRSANFNALLDAARGEPNPSVRRATLEEAERVLLSDYPVIPIYFYNARRLVKPYVGGASITPLNRAYSRHLYWR